MSIGELKLSIHYNWTEYIIYIHVYVHVCSCMYICAVTILIISHIDENWQLPFHLCNVRGMPFLHLFASPGCHCPRTIDYICLHGPPLYQIYIPK